MSLPRNWPPTREDELEMMVTPSEWPNLTRLPLTRRRGNDKELGFLVVGQRLRVFLGPIFMQIDPRGATPESIHYLTAEAVYEDGWRVD